MSRKPLTAGERERRRAADRRRMQSAVAELLSSEGWARWVRIRSRNGLARYSLNNQLLIALQRPDATYVAGFRAFLELNLCVRKGERAIRILAPAGVIRRADDARKEEDEAGEPRARTLFRVIAVFDVAQTEPLPGTQPVPLEPPSEPVTGNTHRHLLGPLEDFAGELGYSIIYCRGAGDAQGSCDKRQRRITVDAGLPANGRLRVLIHELAHALDVGYERYGRDRAEVIVDTVTFIVCSSVGLDVSQSSVPYVAGWGERDAAAAICEYASLIDRTAARLEAALLPGAPTDSSCEHTDSETPPANVVSLAAQRMPAASIAAAIEPKVLRIVSPQGR